MKAKTTTTEERFITCPECGVASFSYGHLAKNNIYRFGAWYCDECGCGIVGTVDNNGDVDIELHTDRTAKTLVLLRLECSPTDAPINIVVEGFVFHKTGELPVIDKDREEHFYNEHTCPWNYLRLPIKHGDDIDPHGVFVHQETVLMPEGFDIDIHLDEDISQWKAVFNSLNDGELQ